MSVPFTKRVASAAAIFALASLMGAKAEVGVEKALKSNLTAVKLTAGAYRSTNQEDVAKFEEALNKVAQTNNGHIVKCEVLIWQGGKKAKKDFPARLKEAGYSYTARPAFDAEPGRITPIAAVRKDKKSELVGMWIESDGNLLLAWGTYRPGKQGSPNRPAIGPDPTENQVPTSASERVEPASTDRAGDLSGTWSWTTISSLNYQDTVTKQLAAPSGMSAKFTFSANGRYTKFFYVRQRTYNLVTESTTTEEGTFVNNYDGSLTLTPTKGHYKGNIGTRIIDRPMTAEERKPRTWYYEWRDEAGKRALYLGPSKESLSPFKRAE